MFGKVIGKINELMSGLTGELSTLGKRRQSVAEKKKYLETAPPPKSDVVAYLCAELDRMAGGYDQALQFTVDRLSGDPLNFSKVNGIHVFLAAPQGCAPSLQTFEAAIVAIFRDEIKAALRKRIEAMRWPEAGPPVAERPAMIEEAAHELAGLDKDLADFRREAANAGVII